MEVDSLASLQADAQQCQAELDELIAEVASLRRGEIPESHVPEELTELRSKNAELRYHINFLKKSIAREGGECAPMQENGNTSKCALTLLSEIFSKAFNAAFPEASGQVQVGVTPSTNEKFGDYQCNVAMPATKYFKKVGKNISSVEIAERVVEKLVPGSLIGSTSIAGPGFINIKLNLDFVRDATLCILKNGVSPPRVDRKLRVVVDFSSPNIAKQMHVGHLRSTIIGESISRLLEFVGHDVLRLNHIGDWGTQFGMLIAHLMDKFPDYKENVPPVADLQEFYKESKMRFDSDPAFKSRAYEAVVRLQSKEKDIVKAWQLICDVSRKEMQSVYDRLDITLLERGESFYNELMIDVVKDLDRRGLLSLEDGRKVMYPQEENLVPMTIVKSDGGFTYDTSDMASIRHRVGVEKGDWLIYVVDSGQSSHFKQLFKCAQIAGYVDEKTRLSFVGFGLVLGEDRKKLKTRSGETVKLNDLLDEGLQRCREKLLAKGRDKELTPEELKRAQEAVAYGCIKFADLVNSRTNDYICSFDRMLDDRGKTAAYLLYSLTRIRSIARQAGVDTAELRKSITKLDLDHPKEIKLAKQLLKYPEILLTILEDLYIHPLCDYLYDLSSTFSEFYDNCYCIVKNRTTGEIESVNMSRLALCEATAQVMEMCFKILGIRTVDRM
ncbi:arginine--tRNA ligase, cytoplasmic [Galendromus occidentalis]|uniref:Probable arginine--tRNA ligase, cytoplasmic n=1 Tax=Galendromus occidentalis TaxID=34638 RepID=A0AAJ7L3U9_9ACAR|nr:arginine--tRNA ligase, cytoplasmic [Galendromus occidentalis]